MTKEHLIRLLIEIESEEAHSKHILFSEDLRNRVSDAIKSYMPQLVNSYVIKRKNEKTN